MKHLLMVLALAWISTQGLTQNKGSYRVIYEADKEGSVITGDRADLIDYISNGSPLRVGWTLEFVNPSTGSIESFSHWADAGFITILNGHVFAQIQSIYQQGPGLGNPPSVFLSNNKPHGWVAVIGSTGIVRQKFADVEGMTTMLKSSGFSDDEVKEEIKKMETAKFATKWAVPVN